MNFNIFGGFQKNDYFLGYADIYTERYNESTEPIDAVNILPLASFFFFFFLGGGGGGGYCKTGLFLRVISMYFRVFS